MAKRELRTNEAVGVLTDALKRKTIDLSDDPLYKELLQEEQKWKFAKQAFVASQAVFLPFSIYEFRFRQKQSWGITISRVSLMGVFCLTMYFMCPPIRNYHRLMGEIARTHREELRNLLDKEVQKGIS